MSRRGTLKAAATSAIGLIPPFTLSDPAQAETIFPYPGGGPVAIHGYVDPAPWPPQAWLLNSVSGRYQRLDFSNLALSPDGTVAAVVDGTGIVPEVGIADRRALQSRGAGAVRRLGLPNSNVVSFSPDGRALMSYTVDKGESGIGFTAYRYEVATRAVRTTTIAGVAATSPPQWAWDSLRYLINITDPADPDGPGRMHYVNPDGSLGGLFTAEGGMIRQYCPAARMVLIDPPLPFADAAPAPWKMPKVVCVQTGRIIARIPSLVVDLGVPTPAPALGWRTRTEVVRFSPAAATPTLEAVDVHSGVVARRIPAPGLNPISYSDLRPTGLLTGPAVRAGF